MKLYFNRRLHEDTKGFIARQSVTRFLLHSRIEFTPDEAALINKYQIGRYFIWERSELEIRELVELKETAMPDSVRIDKLVGDGMDVMFPSFIRMLNAEDAIKKGVKDFSLLMTEAKEFEQEQVFEF